MATPRFARLPVEMRTHVSDFVDRAFAYAKAPFEKDDDPPETVFHYTNSQGLEKILLNGTMWLSDVQSMNDRSEIVHGMRKATRMLQSRAGTKLHRRWFAKRYAKHVEDARTGQNFHVACLTSKGDDLSQWRGYGDNGYGFAIGFDGPALVGALKKQWGSRAYVRALALKYIDQELEDRVLPLAEMAMDYLDGVEALSRGDRRSGIVAGVEMLTQLMVDLMLMATQHKHWEFRYEEEFRLMAMFSSDSSIDHGFKVRMRGGIPVNYSDLTWATTGTTFPLKGIIAGPSNNIDDEHKREVRQYMRWCRKQFLEKFKARGKVELKLSEIPYTAG